VWIRLRQGYGATNWIGTVTDAGYFDTRHGESVH
jgi:hypothetical protein